MKRLVLPITRAQAEHAADVTARLREDEPPLGLEEREAICPSCTFAFLVPSRPTWGLCPDCFDPLEPVEV